MPASEQGMRMVRESLRHPATALGEAFIAGHPFYGHDEAFPKTAAMIRDLAGKVASGEMTYEAADHRAIQALHTECDELYPMARIELERFQRSHDVFAQIDALL